MKKISNEVLCERIENLFRENKEDHQMIIEQTKKTNGTVADIQKWRFTINGALIIMNLFFVPIILFLIYKQFE
jgi:hypothetical protein